jgi:shikimate dehydrogenase
LLLVNRNLQKAQEVASRWQSLDATAADWLSVAPLELLAEPWTGPGPELVINATSASLTEQQLAIHPSVFSRVRAAVDMMYGPAPTAFMQQAQQAQQAGAAWVTDGLGMLVEQAAEAFFLWRGIRPETASVLAELRLQLAPSS